jgi:hypothetical protein
MKRVSLASMLGAACIAAHADDSTTLKNWFNDPFFQVRDGMAACPTPLGPLLTEAEMKSESHSRVERGTSCWMAGTCKEPNAYRYDAEIGKAVQARFHDEPGFRDSSLWVTVKRRIVWIEGCAGKDANAQAMEKELERIALSVPDVERTIVNLRVGTKGKPPYPVAPQESR